jgi:signal transduction histidine kinase
MLLAVLDRCVGAQPPDRVRSGAAVALAGQVESLSEANGLLTLVNSVARTLPTSLTLREALHTAQRQIADTFDARVVCLLTLDENAEEWVPKLADGCVLHPAYRTETCPSRSQRHSRSPSRCCGPTSRSPTATGSAPRAAAASTCGSRPGVADRTARPGAPRARHFDERDVRVLTGLAEVLALTIDNARWFGRLRSLGAEEERVRLARDLHDRLGQWLTYIGFELERIIATEPSRVRRPRPPARRRPVRARRAA